MTLIPYIIFVRESGEYHVLAVVYDEMWLEKIINTITLRAPIKIERAGSIIDPLKERRYPSDQEMGE